MVCIAYGPPLPAPNHHLSRISDLSDEQKFVSRREYYCDSPPCICRPPCYTPNDHQTPQLHNLTNIWGYGCLFVCLLCCRCVSDVQCHVHSVQGNATKAKCRKRRIFWKDFIPFLSEINLAQFETNQGGSNKTS